MMSRGRVLRALALAACLAASGEAAADASCSIEGEMLACDLRAGETTVYVLDEAPARSLKLTNRSSRAVQITEVRVEPVVRTGWGEYCVTLRDLSMHQKEPGFGEVGCTHKSAAETGFSPLRWGGAGGGLSVPPGTIVYVGGYVNAAARKDYRKSVQISVALEARAVAAFRQPREDVIIRCTGKREKTALQPWRNDTGGDLVVTGAIIFAADAEKNDVVDSACIETWEADGKTLKWRHCDGVRRRGIVQFGPVIVGPGEYIAGQARNRCTRGQWDWAAYIYTCAPLDCPPADARHPR